MEPEEEVAGGWSGLDCRGSWMLTSGLQTLQTLDCGQ